MPVGAVAIVGAGPGDPGLMTVRGLDRLRSADVVVYDRLVNPALLDEAPRDALRIFAGKHAGAHTLSQGAINELLVSPARLGRFVVRLKGGDPFVFGRRGEEAEALAAAGIPFEIVPGVTSAIAVPAYAGIPVTHRRVASSFAVVTGHEEAGKAQSAVRWDLLATAVDTIVVLMGAQSLPAIAETLVRHGRSPDTPVALIRCGTTDAQEVRIDSIGALASAPAGTGVAAPVIAVIGEVVRVRERLDWFVASHVTLGR